LGFNGASCAGARFLQVSKNWNHCIWPWPVPSYSLLSPFFQLLIVFIGQWDLGFGKIQLDLSPFFNDLFPDQPRLRNMNSFSECVTVFELTTSLSMMSTV